MRRIAGIITLLLLPVNGFAAESVLDYFKGRLPATTPPAATDTIPIMQGNGGAIRMIKPSDLGGVVAWFAITGKPSVFTPSAHGSNHQTTGSDPLTLTTGQVTGLDTALGNKVDSTDLRLTDARAPLAHTQAAGTITGLSGVATSGSYIDLSNKPTIPAAQVNSDWSAASGVSQILNKPTLAAVATSGSYTDLSNKPAIPSEATDISYTNPSYPTVAAALDQLLYVPISISSYTLDGGSNVNREIGSSYTVGTLAWSTNKTAASQTINSVARTSPYGVNQTVSTNQTYTLQVGDGQTTASSSRTVTFTHYRYWGLSVADTLDDAGIIGLANKEFSTSRGQTRSFNPTSEYIYFAYLATGGAATFTVNGFLDSSWVLVQRQFVNASGYSAEFRIYRSAYPLTGAYSVVVS